VHVRSPVGQGGIFLPIDADPFENGDDGAVAVELADDGWWVRESVAGGGSIDLRHFGLTERPVTESANNNVLRDAVAFARNHPDTEIVLQRGVYAFDETRRIDFPCVLRGRGGAMQWHPRQPIRQVPVLEWTGAPRWHTSSEEGMAGWKGCRWHILLCVPVRSEGRRSESCSVGRIAESRRGELPPKRIASRRLRGGLREVRPHGIGTRPSGYTLTVLGHSERGGTGLRHALNK
jgi:hypothetical protein